MRRAEFEDRGAIREASMADRMQAIDGDAPARDTARIDELRQLASSSGHLEAARILADEPDPTVAGALDGLPPALAVATLWELPDEKRERVLACVPARQREQWIRNHAYPAGSVGRLMECIHAVFSPDETVAAVVERLRELVQRTLISYGYVVDADGMLVGVLIFRELLFAPHDRRVHEVMIPNPYSLDASSEVMLAMQKAVKRHYPEYPVVDAANRLLGIVRGQTLFEQHAFELSAQPGQMVGVESDERLTTSWPRSLRFRQPWLQLNLLTAFIAAAVVGVFQDTIDRIVILAIFLPVLAGQSGNTGCQALAVALRGMTLGELRAGKERALVVKEAFLGLLNGALVGVSAGVAMFFVARAQGNPNAIILGAIVFAAMICSCIVSGLSGALIPLTLRKLGADPATASSIFLTTATDVASMGIFLSLATVLIPK
jgi:magnesium transporter